MSEGEMSNHDLTESLSGSYKCAGSIFHRHAGALGMWEI